MALCKVKLGGTMARKSKHGKKVSRWTSRQDVKVSAKKKRRLEAKVFE